MKHLSHFIVFALTVALLASCGVRQGEFRISGTYEGMNQSDLPLVNIVGDSGIIDTLHVLNGEFDYENRLEDKGTFYIIYPNNTQLILWIHSGDHITIEANTQDMWHAKVEGNEENELYSEFRQQTDAKDTTKLRQVAARFIRQYPESPVSCFLLTQYFIIPDDVPLDSINTLYKAMQESAPGNTDVASLGGQIKQRTALRVGQKMPNFDIVTTDSVHHRLQQYKGQTLIFYFWAGWQGASAIYHNEILRAKDKMEDPTSSSFKSVSVLGYCLDVDETTMNVNINDEMRSRIPTYCDYQGFNSPLINQLGIRTVPLIIVIGPDGKIQHLFTDLNSFQHQYGID